jgi:hypothetical protein
MPIADAGPNSFHAEQRFAHLQIFTKINWSGLSRILTLLESRSAAPGQ